ncbi:MAG: N-acetylmuramoyl-L-alanine amidase [Lachnospiraceae bacterium]|nr:N-acetylmuramoyl-L-alanine amidase [Lachnospiraceae bacterium]MCI9202700.1 N-acetylmuramoyl-L-alanine amidase [Lachnospiraceae bacterium]
MVGILMVSMFVLAREGAVYVTSLQVENKSRACVVIDAGHGGSDPGKVGINNQLEKEINLKIAEILKDFLQAEGIEVVMTRESDAGLYDEGASNKKVQDMKRRLEIIEKADPVIVVSIHQNSYHEEYVKGAQVFYYTTSESSRQLAEVIQEQLRSLDPDNRREAKGNDSYFLLKKTSKPIVIVECGFLSNREEAEKLSSALFQEKMAWNIHMGIMKYLNRNGGK